MNFFLKGLNITSKGFLQEDVDFYKNLPKALFETLSLYGGDTLNKGLYRIHSFRSSVKWSLLLGEYFMGYQGEIYPFGFDWMGRQFCINKENNIIFMFDPATLEDFKMEMSLSLFHKEELANGMLAPEYFEQVLLFCSVRAIDFNECLGYKRPFFLGGKDVVENFQKQDLEVYWHMHSEMYNQAKDLPDRTKIEKVKIIK